MHVSTVCYTHTVYLSLILFSTFFRCGSSKITTTATNRSYTQFLYNPRVFQQHQVDKNDKLIIHVILTVRHTDTLFHS